MYRSRAAQGRSYLCQVDQRCPKSPPRWLNLRFRHEKKPLVEEQKSHLIVDEGNVNVNAIFRGFRHGEVALQVSPKKNGRLLSTWAARSRLRDR